MKFVTIEVLYNSPNNNRSNYPVISSDLYNLVSCLDSSENVIAFKVIDTQPVMPNYFGYAPFIAWKKWVLKFEKEYFSY